MNAEAQGAIFSLRGLERHFVQPQDMVDKLGRLLRGRAAPRPVQAVAGVDLDVIAGEVLGLVGESGCGKSTLGRMVAGILPPTRGRNPVQGPRSQRSMPPRGTNTELKVQMIFQDPFASLNPRMRVVDIVGEAPLAHGMITRAEFDPMCAS